MLVPTLVCTFLLGHKPVLCLVSMHNKAYMQISRHLAAHDIQVVLCCSLFVLRCF